MAGHCCFICATDEGILLDAADNKQICQSIERCLYVKIPTTDQASIKVCYKCAFESSLCNSFLQKYEQYKRSSINNKKCCIVCHQAGKTRSIFDFSDDTDFQRKSFNKIQKVFNDQFQKSIEDFKFMCLSCLYAVDVLLDLKNICKSTSTHLTDITNKKIDYSTFPKTDTAIVSRKTTSTQSSKVTLQDLENKMTRTRSQNTKLTDEQSDKKVNERCTLCHGFIDRLRKTARLLSTSICATCQEKNKRSAKSTKLTEKQNLSGTKDCAVYLKDVMKNNEMKEQQVSKVEEDAEDSKTSAVKEKDSKKLEKKEIRGKKRSVETESEDTSFEEVPKKKKQKATEEEESQVSEINDDLEDKKSVVKEKVSKTEKKLEKKKKITKRSVEAETEDTSNEDVPKKKRLKSVEGPSNDSNSSSVAQRTRQLRNRNVEPAPKPANGKKLTKRQQSITLSSSDTETNKDSRLRTKKSLRGNNENDKSSSNDYVSSKRNWKRIKSTSPSSDPSEQTESETKNTQVTGESDKEDVPSTEAYICGECGASFENKLTSLSHKLSHYKQPKIELQKIAPETSLKASDEQNADDQIEEPSENIRIVVEDDEEEAEMNENKSAHDDSTVEDESKEVSQRETVEDDNVDMKLVMKDSDEEQNLKLDDTEMQKDTSFVEDVEGSTSNYLTQDKNAKAEDKRKSNETTENNNDKADKSLEEAENVNKNSEEEQGITNGHIEDVQKQTKEVEQEGDTENESMVEDKENESIVEDKENRSMVENKENENMIEDKENKSMQDDQENKSMQGDQENESMQDDQENKGMEKDEENESTVVDKENNEDINQEEDKETVTGNNEEEEEIETPRKEREIEIEQTEKDKDEIEDIENGEKEEEDKTIDLEEENLNISRKTIKDSIVIEDDSPKESNDSEIQELEKGDDVQSDQMGTSKEKSLESEKRKSVKRSVIEICDSDSQDSVVLQSDELNIADDEDTVVVLEDEEKKRQKSMSDSANAAAEVLQEVLDLASAEFQKRLENMNKDNENDIVEAETLENISREVYNGGDSLESEATKREDPSLVE